MSGVDKSDIRHVVAVTLECDCIGGSPASAFALLLSQLPQEVMSGDVRLEKFRIAEAHYVRALPRAEDAV